MRFFKIVGISMLSVAFCLFMGWAAMVMVHAGEDGASELTAFPAPPAAEGDLAADDTVPATEPPLAPPGVPPLAPPSDVRRGTDPFGAEDFVLSDDVLGGEPYADSLIRRRGSDPLKDITELGKATAAQLQAGDRYLESKTRRLAEQYAKTKDTEGQPNRDKLKGELAKTIERHFDVRHQVRKREIDQLEARVRRLRGHLQKRQGARQAIVEMRVKQFISAAEGLGWDADFGGSRSRLGWTRRSSIGLPGVSFGLPHMEVGAPADGRTHTHTEPGAGGHLVPTRY